MSSFTDYLFKLWYQKNLHPLLWALVPLSLFMSGLVYFRKLLYQVGILKCVNFPVPIIVVGNLTMGGTGKTPLVIHIAKLLKQHGYHPGIVSRGYKGSSQSEVWVNAASDPNHVGDEPVLLAKRLFCPIVVGKKRVQAVRTLLQFSTHEKISVIISDDGLQHEALGRTIDIIVIDGERRFGNGWCIPAGPLREPLSRLKSADFLVVNSATSFDNDIEYDMELRPRFLTNGNNSSEQRLLNTFQGMTVHAVAAIGNPNRFFALLQNYGLNVIPHPFPDHHVFTSQEINFPDEYPVLMTEKDAVKCEAIMTDQHWILSVDAIVNPLFDVRLLKSLKEFQRGQKIT